MCTIEICRRIESHSCRIGGETYRFRIRPAADRPGAAPTPATHAVLEVEAFRGDGHEKSVARMRITAPALELPRIPSLLTKALEQWLLATAAHAGSVH